MKHSQARIKTMIHGVIRGKNRGLPSQLIPIRRAKQEKGFSCKR
jgi:hypothetical protein